MSMVSDTWSTDVLASDSENVEQPDLSGTRSDTYMLDSAVCINIYSGFQLFRTSFE